jgi:hypothetical protein
MQTTTDHGPSSSRLESITSSQSSRISTNNSIVGLSGGETSLVPSPPPTRTTSRRTTDTSILSRQSASQQAGQMLTNFVTSQNSRNSRNSINLITIPPPPYKP